MNFKKLFFNLFTVFTVFTISSQSFVTTWNPGSNKTISIGVGAFNYNFDVDWGDGTTETLTFNGAVKVRFEHTYTASSIQTVTITPNVSDGFPAIRMGVSNGPAKLLTVEKFGTVAFQTFRSAFAGCTNLTISPTAGGPTFDNSLTSLDIGKAFERCTSLTSINASSWDVSKVTIAFGLFEKATNFNEDLSSWSMASVTSINNMFNNATSFNSPVFAIPNATLTTMFNVFYGATEFNQSLASWKVDNVITMRDSFNGAIAFNGSLSGWNVSKVTNMGSLFNGAVAFNQDISGWNVAKVTNMNAMFLGATSFNQDISSWTLGDVNIADMFNGATSFNQNLATWDFSKITSSMNNFLSMANAFSDDNYDALLTSWASTSPTKPTITGALLVFKVGIVYCSPIAIAARENLIDNQSFDFQNDIKCRTFITSPSSLEINEGNTATFTIQLSKFPEDGNVAFDISSNSALATVNMSDITITNDGNWSAPRVITVTAVDDAVYNDTSNITVTVAVDKINTTDDSYKVNDPQEIAVTVIDEDGVHTWNGNGGNNNPNDVSNWNGGKPNSLSIVNLSASDQVTWNDNIIAKTINIASGGSLISTATVNASMNVKRNLATTNWYLIASPVSGHDVDDFASASGVDANNNNLGLATYNNNSATPWDYYQSGTSTGTETFVPGMGRSIKLASGGEVTFSGVFNDKDVSIPVSLGAKSGFNLIGNPYTSSISVTDLLTSNSSILSEQTIWMWNQAVGGGSYEIILLPSSTYIAPGQAFFIETNASGNFNITKNMQSHQADSFKKSANIRPEITLNLSNGERNKKATILYLERATKGFDNGCDGSIFGGVANDFAIYTHTVEEGVEKKLGIQSLPNSDYENMIIPIGVNSEADKELTFSAKSVNLPVGINMVLEDRENNIFTSLDNDAVYKVFSSSDLNGVGRFYLHTSSASLSASNNLNASNNLSVYNTDSSTLRIVGLEQGSSTVKLFNITGGQVLLTSFKSNGIKELSLPKLAAGLYLVKVQSRTRNLTKKIILE